MLNNHKNFKTLGFVVAAGVVLIFCWGIWSVPILSHNEARRMVVVQEMLESGDWLVPTMNGEVYLAKPPLLYWLMALSCTVFNTQAEWAMRLPSSLMAVALAGLFLLQARRYLGLAPAVLGTAILATSPDIIEFARTAQIEMLLTLTCTLAVFWFLDHLKTGKKRWLYLSFAALGCAILTKGPVALIFFVPPALLFCLVGRDWAALRAACSIKGWLIALTIALPWFLYLFVEHKDLIDHVISEDIADKVAGVSRSSPLYTYPLFLLGSFAPWILVIFFRPREQVRRIFSGTVQRYYLIFALVPVLIMSLVSEKHGKYLLPIFPALAMVLGTWCHELYCRFAKDDPHKAMRWTFSVVGTLLAGHFLFQVVVTPRLYSYRFSALKPMAEAIRERAQGRPVYFHNEMVIQLVYYAGQPLPVKKTKEIREMINARESFLLIAENKTWPAIADLPLCLVEEFSPFIKKDRKAKLLGSGDFCGSGVSGTKSQAGS